MASVGFEDSHDALLVTSRDVPSDIRAVAVSWNDAPDVDAPVTTTAVTVVVGVGAVALAGRSLPHAIVMIVSPAKTAAMRILRTVLPS